MRIDIPQSSFPRTRLYIETLDGPLSNVDIQRGQSHIDFEIPEGISIDEIGVRYECFGNGRTPIEGSGGVLKVPTPPPAPPKAPPPAPFTPPTPKPKPAPKPIVPVADIPKDEPKPEPKFPLGYPEEPSIKADEPKADEPKADEPKSE